MRIVLRVTEFIMWQGEPKDSSDEEWEAAYAAMDPVAQIGWGNHAREGHQVGQQLVRDVFEAADEMHDNAMFEMEGNTEVEGNYEVEDVSANLLTSEPESRPWLERDSTLDPLDGVDVAEEGGNSLPDSWMRVVPTCLNLQIPTQGCFISVCMNSTKIFYALIACVVPPPLHECWGSYHVQVFLLKYTQCVNP